MTRNNADFRNSALFHGTAHPFKVGDIIEPRMHKGAFATTKQEVAEHYAWNRTREYNWANGTEEEPKVFQVEPVNEETVNKYGKNTVASVDGFRVVRQVK
jgi:hypothetical protein